MILETNLLNLLLVSIAYLIGTLPSALWVCRVIIGIDPRDHGSNNPGATNVYRLAGRKAALLTFVGDFGKGWATVELVELATQNHQIIAIAAIAVTLGHIIPFYAFRRGGKGVATAMGVCLGFYWPLAVLLMALWIGIFLVTRISSFASLLSICVTCLFCSFYLGQYEEITAALGLLLVVSHRENIRRLVNKKENRF